ncbi:glycosyltransferase family 2 protein [Inquilinus sp. CAU 1745]|uniref:glycosyltransferase family 2 protein n=1 Tax=Inquilinus sp. CAU 1745 TaxID=3140369 RepID=UPI00325B3DBB
MSDRPRLSIVIAAYNESGNIGLLLREIAELFAAEPYEAIVVDDGSDDRTAASVMEAAAGEPRIMLVQHVLRSGKSAAIWTGVGRARGDWIATLDGDGQNDPRDLLALWHRLRDDEIPPDLWIFAGSRRRRNDGFVKFVTSRLGNWLRRRLLRDDTGDTGCGFKVIRADVFRALPYFDNMHRFYPALVRRAGGKVEEVSIDDRPRQFGTSKYGFFDRLAVGALDLIGVYWLCRRASWPRIREDGSK